MKVAAIATSLILFSTSVSYANSCDFNKQVTALALNMYHEARDQGIDGMQMVGEVTLNRVANKAFPNNICSVVYQANKDEKNNIILHKCQFSWYCDGKPDKPLEKESWETAKSLAEDMITGKTELYNNNATHFLNLKIVKNIPNWAKKFTKVGGVKDHVFYYMGTE
jgi:N-acetylmuramoyl-L-alanine amidase